MAIDSLNLPTFDLDAFYEKSQFRNRNSPKPPAPAKQEPVDYMAQLSPADQRQVQLAVTPRSALGEIGASAMRGITSDMPRMVGQGLKAFGQPGDAVYEAGEWVNQAVEPMGLKYAKDLNPGAHNVVTETVADVAGMLPPMVPIIGAGMLAPATGGASLAASTAMAGALFGPSTYQDTYERAVAAGKTPGEAHAAGLKTGAIMGAGMSAGGMVAGQALRAGSRLGGKATLTEALEAIQNPSFLGEFGKKLALNTVEQTAVQAGAAAGVAAVEQDAGIPTHTPWEAATASLAPAIGLSMVFGALGAPGIAARQSRNKALLAKVNSGEAPIGEVSAATRELAAQMEPMVGKQQTVEWRLDALEKANSGELSKIAAEEHAREQAELAANAEAQAGLREQELNAALQPDQYQNEAQGMIPGVRDLPGVTPTAPHYRGGAMDAEMTWQALLAERDAKQGAQNRVALEEKLVNNPPEGVMPYAAWKKQQTPSPMGGEAVKTGLKQGYINYVRDTIATRPEARFEDTRTDTLDLGHPNKPAPVRPAEPPPPRPPGPWEMRPAKEGPQPTAMEVAMRRGQEDAAYAQRDAQRKTARVEELRAGWQQAAAEQGIDTGALRGQSAARIKKLFNDVAGLPPEKQLPALKEARDKMKPNTVTRDALDAYIARLENANEATRTDAANVGGGTKPESTPREAAAALPGETVRADEGIAATAANAAVGAQPREVANATQARVQQQGDLLQRQGNDGVGAPAEASGRGGAEPSTPTWEGITPAQEQKLAAHIAARSGVPVEQVVAEFRANAAKNRIDVPESEQREIRFPKSAGYRENEGRYTFEIVNYMPDKSINASVNRAWASSYLDAYRAAAMLDPNGAPAKKTQAALLEQKNAQAALDWLKRYEGNDAIGSADKRAEMYVRALASAERAEQVSKEMEARYRDAFAKELKVELLREHQAEAREHFTAEELADIFQQAEDKPPTARDLGKIEAERRADRIERKFDKITSAKQKAQFDAAIKRIVERHLQTEMPNYLPDEGVRKALSSSDLGKTLTHLADQGPSMWVRDFADYLNKLGLKTTIRNTDTSVVDKDGKRVFGSYDHGKNAVEVNYGGDNAHTVLHEVTHAATAGRIEEGLAALALPEARRSPSQRNAAADLMEVRRIKNAVERAGGGWKFKNEHEFVTEVLTNEKFQKWLGEKSVDGRSLWTRAVDWFKDVLGISRQDLPLLNALERSMRTGMSFATNSRFNSARAGTFEHTAAITDEVMVRSKREMDRLLQSVDTLGNMRPNVRKTLLQLGTMFHIQKWSEKTPALRPISTGIREFFNTDKLTKEIMQEKRREFDNALRPVELEIAKLPFKERTAMNATVMRLMGEQSAMNVDLRLNYAKNFERDKTLDPAQRDYINNLHAEYVKLPPEMRAALEHSQRIYRKNFIQQNAVMLQVYLRALAQSQKYGAVKPLVDQLDIRDPALSKASKNTNPDFYADAYTSALDAKLREVYGTLEKAQGLGDEFKEMNTFYRSAITNPYMHLGRKGDFFVEFDIAKTPEAYESVRAAMEPFGKIIGNPGKDTRHVFMRFENYNQMLLAREKVDALGAVAEAPNSGSLLNRSEFELAAGVPQFAKRLLSSIDTAFEGLDLAPEQLSAIRDYVKREALDAIPDTSARKATMKRREGAVKGYDADFLRSYATRAEGMASMLANGYTMHQYDSAFRSMKDAMTKMGEVSGADSAHARDIYAELARRFSNTMSPVNSPAVDGLKAFGYNFYLAFSPAFYMVNMMQPYHLTLPVLGGRYGYVRSAKEMASSTAKALRIVYSTLKHGGSEGSGTWGTALALLDANLKFDDAGLSAPEKAFVERLLASGQLDTTQSYSLGRLASGSSVGWSNTMKFVAAGSHYTEVVNRLTAGLAGFNLEMKAGKNFEKATSRGIDDAVRGTQYDYSDHNTASALGRHGWAGPVTPLMSSFQNYALQTSELLLRLVRDAAFRAPKGSTPDELARISAERKVAVKTLGGIMATTSMLAGTLGLPMASVVTRLADALLSEDDNPVDSKHAYRQWLAEAIGDEPAEMVARGIPRALMGVDFSTRAGLQDILPGTRFLTDMRKVEDAMQTGAMNLMGPAMGGAVKDMVTGMSHMANGQMMDGLIQAMPLALRGPGKAIKMNQQGYTSSTGVQLPMKVTPGATLAQSLGFTPSVKAEQAEVNFRMRTRDMLLKQEQARIRAQVVREYEQEGGLTTDTQIRLQNWNMNNPQQAINPMTTLMSRAKMRAVADISGTGIAALPKYLPMLEDYTYAVTE